MNIRKFKYFLMRIFVCIIFTSVSQSVIGPGIELLKRAAKKSLTEDGEGGGGGQPIQPRFPKVFLKTLYFNASLDSYSVVQSTWCVVGQVSL